MSSWVVDMSIRGTGYQETLEEWVSELQVAEAKMHRRETGMRVLLEDR